jgi:hypothetical protein
MSFIGAFRFLETDKISSPNTYFHYPQLLCKNKWSGVFPAGDFVPVEDLAKAVKGYAR